MFNNIQKTHIKLLVIFIFIFTIVPAAFAKQTIPDWARHYFEKDIMSETNEQKKDRLTKILNKAFKKNDFHDEISIILKVSADYKPEGFLSATSKQTQRNTIKSAQDKVITKLKNKSSYYNSKKFHKFESVPYINIRIKRDEIDDFVDIPEIENIEIDELSSVSMAESNAIIGSTNAWADGYTGAGQVVAVLDTGVQKTHAFLSGKVVSEACYSNANGAGTGITLCPGGATATTASGSGVNCSASVDGCDHGTHVAGTIAGDNGPGGISGVAPDADIIAINVFTNLNGEALSYTSDQIRGLERVYALRNSYDIASVNMSLGGGSYSSYCDGDSRKQIIDNLRSVGIATVIATGNYGYTSSISAPACISSAIAVGSTQDGSYGTDLDKISSFSNSSNLVDMLAPGQYITSSVPGGGYSAWSGTSMATPHVAGAFALVKSASGTATVSEIEGALETTGSPIKDTRNNVTKPRINVDDAITSFGTGSITITISPENAISAGAQWTLDGSTWKNSGDTVAELSIGNHTAVMKSITHSDSSKVWITPTLPTQTIAADGDEISHTVTYVEQSKSYTTKDFNGEGKSDVLFRHASDGRFLIWTMDGEVVTEANMVQGENGATKAPALSTWEYKATADFDGDGKSDIILQNVNYGSLLIWTMDGKVVTSVDYAQDSDGNPKSPAPTIWELKTAADFNGDNKSDLLFRHIRTGSFLIWTMNGKVVTSVDYAQDSDGNPKSPAPTTWEFKAAADFDGDGNSDLLFRHIRTGSFLVWTMNGKVVTSVDYAQDSDGNPKSPAPTTWEFKAAADFDGDGNSDLLFRHIRAGSFLVWTMDGKVVTSVDYAQDSDGNPKSPSLTVWQFITTADYDGDGKSDILFRNTTYNSMLIWLMDGKVVTTADFTQSVDGVQKNPDINIWERLQ